MTDRELMQQALEAFGEIAWSNNSQWQADRAKVAITALCKAKQSAQQQEPVAWWNATKDTVSVDPVHRHNSDCQPLYTSPSASKPWVGLTDEEIELACVPLGAAMLSFTEVAHAIEAKLKEKNT